MQGRAKMILVTRLDKPKNQSKHMNAAISLSAIELTDYELSLLAGGDAGTTAAVGGAGGVALGGSAIAAGNAASGTIGAAAAGEVVAGGVLFVAGGLILASFAVGWYAGQGLNSLIWG